MVYLPMLGTQGMIVKLQAHILVNKIASLTRKNVCMGWHYRWL